jgi:hypothetical protein
VPPASWIETATSSPVSRPVTSVGTPLPTGTPSMVTAPAGSVVDAVTVTVPAVSGPVSIAKRSVVGW